VISGGWRGPGWRVVDADPGRGKPVRDRIRSAIARHHCPVDPADAALAAGELYANAVMHGPPGGRVLAGYCLWSGGTRIVVCDGGGPATPQRQDSSPGRRRPGPSGRRRDRRPLGHLPPRPHRDTGGLARLRPAAARPGQRRLGLALSRAVQLPAVRARPAARPGTRADLAGGTASPADPGAYGSWHWRADRRPVSAGLGGTGLIADDLHLLAHHDVTGKALLQPRPLGIGLAAGLLAELMLVGSVRLRPDGVVLPGRTWPGDELARQVRDRVAAEQEPRLVREWLLFLARPAASGVAGRLDRSANLTRAGGRVPWQPGRWVPVDDPGAVRDRVCRDDPAHHQQRRPRCLHRRGLGRPAVTWPPGPGLFR
jgi:Golgi phosphoprotein 3 (GPP34)